MHNKKTCEEANNLTLCDDKLAVLMQAKVSIAFRKVT